MIKSPFKIEQKRHELAKAGKNKELISTYNSRYPEIKDSNSPSWFERRHEEHQDSKVKKITDPMEADRLRKVASLIQENKKIKVLNIGVGAVELESIYFKTKKTKTEWYGMDIYKSAIRNASKQFPNGHFKIGDIRKIPYDKNFFDYVCLIEVLEHIRPRDTFKSLSEINKVMKPNGYLILSVPLNEPLEEMVSKGQNPNAHVRVYTPELIKKEIEISGFDVIKEEKLFAFGSHYELKTLISKLFKNHWKPNDIIILSKKK